MKRPILYQMFSVPVQHPLTGGYIPVYQSIIPVLKCIYVRFPNHKTNKK